MRGPSTTAEVIVTIPSIKTVNTPFFNTMSVWRWKDEVVRKSSNVGFHLKLNADPSLVVTFLWMRAEANKIQGPVEMVLKMKCQMKRELQQNYNDFEQLFFLQ